MKENLMGGRIADKILEVCLFEEVDESQHFEYA